MVRICVGSRGSFLRVGILVLCSPLSSRQWQNIQRNDDDIREYLIFDIIFLHAECISNKSFFLIFRGVLWYWMH